MNGSGGASAPAPAGGGGAAGERIPGYAECHFCAVAAKRRSWRCARCVGRLDLRQRFLRSATRRSRRRAARVISLLVPGAGHLWAAHPAAGAFFLAVVSIGLGYWISLEGEVNAGRWVLAGALVAVWIAAALDAGRGESESEPPCQEACPNRLACMRYVQLIRDGAARESLELIQLRCPLPASIGRVCHHPCEKDCRRGREGEPVAICALKRFAADARHGEVDGLYRGAAPPQPVFSERVAVVGGGPSGLSAAMVLRVMGFPVTLFEAEDEPGGAPGQSIPDYRLPGEVYRREVRAMLDAGVELRTGRRLGRDFQLADLAAEGFAAAYLAIGAQRTVKLPHCGTPEQGFLDGVELLRAAKRGAAAPLAGDVLVIGGGNVAMDVAKTARRLGAASVRVIFLETRETMPAHVWECAEAVEEGIVMVPASATVSFEHRDGKVAAAICKRVERIELDEKKRIRPVLWEGTDFRLPADTVLTAVGSGPDWGFLPAPPPRPKLPRGVYVARWAAPGVAIPVVVGGDCLTGPASVIQAIAAGYQAADEICAALGRAPRFAAPVWNRMRRVRYTGYADTPALRVRHQMVMEEAGDRCTSFCEICHVYPEREAVAEAERCLRCRWTIAKPPRGKSADIRLGEHRPPRPKKPA